jgi:hypothetical protein
MARSVRVRLLLPTAMMLVAACVGAAGAHAATPVVMAYLNEAGQLIVQESARPDLAGKRQAFVAWAEGNEDRWQFIAENAVTTPKVRAIAPLPLPSAHFALHAAMHFALPEIAPAKTFLAPCDGSCLLDSNVVIRRTSMANEGRLARVTVLLSGQDLPLLRIPLPEGQSQVALADVSGLPVELKQGLPAGRYVLNLDGNPESLAFTVADASDRNRLFKQTDEIASLVGRSDPLWLQATVEHLLNQRDPGCKTCPFVADALQLLEKSPQTAQTLYLQNLRNDLLRQLGVAVPSAKPPTDREDENTGIPEIDHVLKLSAQGRWTEALQSLQGFPLGPVPGHDPGRRRTRDGGKGQHPV